MKDRIVFTSEPYAAPEPEEMTPALRHEIEQRRRRLERDMRRDGRRNRHPIYCLK